MRVARAVLVTGLASGCLAALAIFGPASAAMEQPAGPSQLAAFTPIDQPTTEYEAATCLADIGTGVGGTIASAVACRNILHFPPPHYPHVFLVPTKGWHAWGQPPAVEDPAPYIAVTEQRELHLDFRRDMTVGGAEVEPRGHATTTITATFYRSRAPRAASSRSVRSPGS